MTIDEERAPDAIEPITAYRVWMADPDGRLWSLKGRFTWPSGIWLQARCTRRRHQAPMERCSCGVYAVDAIGDVPYPLDLALAQGQLARLGVWSPDPDFESVPIVGRVHLAGKVIEHELGYRAERARIAEILPLPGYDAWTDAVSQRYGVPVGDPPPELEPHSVPLFGFGCPGPSTPQAPSGHANPFPGTSLWCLALSVFMVVNAFRGILMNGGPHWSQWWLWPIAMISALVALVSFLTVLGWLGNVLEPRAQTPASPSSPDRGIPEPPIHHPRPY